MRGKGGGWVYVYILLEFPSRSEPYMALRVQTYVGLFYEDLVRQRGERWAGLEELERAFTAWLVEVLLPERAPGVRMPRVDNLREFDAVMTAEKIDWSLRWKQAGREEGRKEGRQEGRASKAHLLEQLLARRFGPLPEAVRQRLAGATDGELDTWALNILDAADLDEVFRR